MELHDQVVVRLRYRKNAYCGQERETVLIFFIRFYFNLFNLILSRVAGSHIYDKNSVISIYNYIVEFKNICTEFLKN